MTSPAPPALIGFTGRVECRRVAGNTLTLAGREGDVPLTVHLGGVESPDLGELPGQLEDARVLERSGQPEGLRSFELQSRGFSGLLRARGLQVHRDASRAFFAAVPPVPVPALRRTGWSVLLVLLRIPGFVGLLKRLREST